jgi:hypothetical protein
VKQVPNRISVLLFAALVALMGGLAIGFLWLMDFEPMGFIFANAVWMLLPMVIGVHGARRRGEGIIMVVAATFFFGWIGFGFVLLTRHRRPSVRSAE